MSVSSYLPSVRFRTATTSLAVIGLLGAACSADAEPGTLPPLTASPSTTATPVQVPAEAQAHTAQGADAFVRFFFAQMNVAFSTSNPDLIRQLSNDGVRDVQNYAKALAD